MYPAVILCQCPLCCLAMNPCTHSQQSPLSCALTKPCRNKSQRAKPLKRKRSSLCDHLLCPFFQSSSLRDKKPSACRQKSVTLVLPPSDPPNLTRLKYLQVIYSSSVPSDFGMCRTFQRMSSTMTNIFTCPVTLEIISQLTFAPRHHTQKPTAIFLLCFCVCELPILSFYLSFAVAL